jgi:RecA/RadA recombinase
VESYNHDRVLSTRGLNTVLFSDPYAKLCYVAELVSSYDNVAYVDLDTAFSAYWRSGLLRAGGRVDVYLPSEGRFLPMVKDVLATMTKGRRSLVVLDSISSFYAMYYNYYRRNERSGGNLNHLLSVLLMLLVRQGASSGVPVLATSMLRYRKEGGWKQSPTSKRLLQQKSATRTSVDLVGNNIVVRVLAHETIPEGTVLSYPVKSLG